MGPQSISVSYHLASTPLHDRHLGVTYHDLGVAFFKIGVRMNKLLIFAVNNGVFFFAVLGLCCCS